jgi:xanthine dehydrogenase YagR molybdenum-binding subunit
MGVASALRGNQITKSAARVRLERRGVVTVETDMTDIGTGSYTIIAQTAAEMMGVPLDKVVVRLGDSTFPVSCGSGGQWGGNCSTAGVYAACVKLREAVAQKLGFNSADTVFADGQVRSGARSVSLAEAAGENGFVAEDAIEYGDLDKRYQQSTFGAHFVEVGVDAATGETRVRRMLARVRRRPHPEPQDRAQPGHRCDDHGRWRGADGGTCGRHAPRLLRQP